MRNQRVIDLGPWPPPPEPPPPPPPLAKSPEDPGWRKVTTTPAGLFHEERHREGGLLHIRTEQHSNKVVEFGTRVEVSRTYVIEPAHVKYEDIFEATEVVIDESNSDRPWDACDGFAHHEVDYTAEIGAAPRGRWVSQHGVGLIMLDDPGPGCYDYYRGLGAAKQVAHECSACQARRTLAQLVEWYAHGWWWYGVKCDFRGYDDSLWGIDDEEYAHSEVREDVADQVAYQMTQDGYTVIRPACMQEASRARILLGYKNRFKRNLHLFDWSCT